MTTPETSSTGEARVTYRRWIFIGIVAVFLGFYLIGPGGLFQEISGGELAPDFVAETLDGSEFHLHDMKGDLVLLDFWASWCGPCRQSAPVIDSIYRELSDGYPELRVIGINIGEDPETARRAAEELGITYTVVLDRDQTIAQEYGVTGIPHFVLLDTNRTILWRGEGFYPSDNPNDTGGTIRKAVLERRAR